MLLRQQRIGQNLGFPVNPEQCVIAEIIGGEGSFNISVLGEIQRPTARVPKTFPSQNSRL